MVLPLIARAATIVPGAVSRLSSGIMSAGRGLAQVGSRGSFARAALSDESRIIDLDSSQYRRLDDIQALPKPEVKMSGVQVSRPSSGIMGAGRGLAQVGSRGSFAQAAISDESRIIDLDSSQYRRLDGIQALPKPEVKMSGIQVSRQSAQYPAVNSRALTRFAGRDSSGIIDLDSSQYRVISSEPVERSSAGNRISQANKYEAIRSETGYQNRYPVTRVANELVPMESTNLGKFTDVTRAYSKNDVLGNMIQKKQEDELFVKKVEKIVQDYLDRNGIGSGFGVNPLALPGKNKKNPKVPKKRKFPASLKKIGLGLGIGAAAGIAADVASGYFGEDTIAGASANVLGQTASGAAQGAVIGSMIPGVGTAAGGVIGGALGFGTSVYDNFKSFSSNKKDEAVEQPVSSYKVKPIKIGKTFMPSDPEVKAALKFASSQFGIPLEEVYSTAYTESSFNPKAGAPTSSARGLFQFISGTWNEVRKNNPDIAAAYGIGPAQGRSFSDDRTDPKKAAVMYGLFRNANRKILGNLTTGDTTTDSYLAHFAGAGGAKKVLKALQSNPSASIRSVLGDKAYSANRSMMSDSNGVPLTVKSFVDVISNKSGARAKAYREEFSKPSTPTPTKSETPVKAAPRPNIASNMAPAYKQAETSKYAASRTTSAPAPAPKAQPKPFERQGPGSPRNPNTTIAKELNSRK